MLTKSEALALKPGDKVRCIKRSLPDLNAGVIYTINSESELDDGTYVTVNIMNHINGRVQGWNHTRFELVKNKKNLPEELEGSNV